MMDTVSKTGQSVEEPVEGELERPGEGATEQPGAGSQPGEGSGEQPGEGVQPGGEGGDQPAEGSVSVEQFIAELEERGIRSRYLDKIKPLLDSLADNGQLTVADVIAGQNLPAGVDIVNVNQDLNADPHAGAVLVMGEGAVANLAFGASSPLRALIMSDSSNNSASFQTDDDLFIYLGNGTNNHLQTGGGSDYVFAAGGQYDISVIGNDTVRVYGMTADSSIVSDDGDMTVELSPGSFGGYVDIEGGAGFDVISKALIDEIDVAWDGQGEKFSVIYKGSVNPDGALQNAYGIETSGVELLYMAPSENHPQAYTKMTVLASTVGDSLAAKLYQIALDRQPFDKGDSLDGIKFWMTEFDQGEGYDGARQTVYSFMNCPEVIAKYAGTSSLEYVKTLFDNLGASGTVGGNTAEEYAAQIDMGGEEARWDVAWAIAASDEAVQLLGNAGAKYVVDGGFDMIGPQA